jgi:hypothetical protein
MSEEEFKRRDREARGKKLPTRPAFPYLDIEEE